MKLELKHLAPYLPYGLEVNANDSDLGIKNFTGEISSWEYYNTRFNVWSEYKLESHMVSIKNIKPILRPLSSMTEKESDELEDIIGCNFYIYVSGNGIEIEDIIIDPWGGQSVLRMETLNRIYEWLFAHHFDVFNLIENNLAIDKTKM